MAKAIGILHPGEMGAAVGAALRSAGHDVVWASAGRSGATAERAAAAGLRDIGTAAEMTEACDVVVSVCPPHAAPPSPARRPASAASTSTRTPSRPRPPGRSARS